MRGETLIQEPMLVAFSLTKRIPADHPLRQIKKLADEILDDMSPLFTRMYAKTGRPGIAPEQLLKATLLMALYSIRSERMFCEQLAYNLLFQWFLDRDIENPSFNHSVFSHNQARLQKHDVAKRFFERVVGLAETKELLSAEHFTVDGTLIEAWASFKSFRPKAEQDEPPSGSLGSGSVDFHGDKRTNETHESKTDPDSRLLRKSKGREAKLSYGLHALTENRHGMLVDLHLGRAVGETEPEVALKLLKRRAAAKSVGGDKGFDTEVFVGGCRDLEITPHVAAKMHSNLDGRTTRHATYTVSQKKRKLIEQVFGWLKAPARFRRTRYIGLKLNRMYAYLNGAAYNLVRMANLLRQEPC